MVSKFVRLAVVLVAIAVVAECYSQAGPGRSRGSLSGAGPQGGQQGQAQGGRQMVGGVSGRRGLNQGQVIGNIQRQGGRGMVGNQGPGQQGQQQQQQQPPQQPQQGGQQPGQQGTQGSARGAMGRAQRGSSSLGSAWSG